MTPERARQIALACADSWYGGAAGMNLKEAIFQGITEACAEDSALAEPEPTQEQTPVAWQLATHKGDAETWIRLSPPIDDADEWRPLFAHPAPAQTPRSVTAEEDAILHKALLRGTKRLDAPAQAPMSDDQIMATASHFFDSPRWPSTAIDLARAVERHHGISS